jgi:hypothetical protein
MQGVDEIEVRPVSSREEYELMLDYFYKADDPFLHGMGVDLNALCERFMLGCFGSLEVRFRDYSGYTVIRKRQP